MSAAAPDLLDLLEEMDAERWECGRHIKGRFDHLIQHGQECWANTCPHCGMSFRYTGEVLDHDPWGRHYEHFGTCWPQRWLFERFASCTACQWPTFGQWPCRNEACERHESQNLGST